MGDQEGPKLWFDPYHGRLKKRIWARTGTGGRVTTTYTYGFENDGISDNQHGDLVGVSYAYDPVGTPPTTIAYNRQGTPKTVTYNGTTTALSYNDAGGLTAETYTGGTLGGVALIRTYDPLLRREGLSMTGAGLAYSMVYGYNPTSGRLDSVSDGTHSAVYSYLANSHLVEHVDHRTGGSSIMITSRQYDNQNRLTYAQTSVTGFDAPPLSHGYLYNSANQRTRATQPNGSYWVYTYDELGQVTSGRKHWVDGEAVAGQHFVYDFDDIGNRKSTMTGGDENGANLRTAIYVPDRLNQYDQRQVPHAVDIIGVAPSSATVTVDSQSVTRQGAYFRKELTLDNSSAPVWEQIDVESDEGGTLYQESGDVFLAESPEVFQHDDDGNLTTDGRWTYSWNAENRLVEMVANSNVPDGAKKRLVFAYDWQGRRTSKTVYEWDSGSETYVSPVATYYVYDGWNLVASLRSDHSILRSFMWGLDLSGTLAGAGGVGGLLAVYDSETIDSAPSTHFPSYDGNGNVMALVEADGSELSARYEYGPFGELIRATGPMAQANPFRFSTKYQDSETDLVYYGYRYYLPSMGVWPNRDPIGEQGGVSLYGFVYNQPSTYLDTDGQLPIIPILIGGGIVVGLELYGIHHYNEKCRNPDNIELERKGSTINVKKCQIVIFVGHAQSKKAPTYNFTFDSPKCSGAGYAGCWPGVVNRGINPISLIPGTPMHDDFMYCAYPNDIKNFDENDMNQFGNRKQNLDYWRGIEEIVKNPETDMTGKSAEMVQNAIMQARAICKRNCCKEVEVIFWNEDGNLQYLPPTYKFIVPCKQSAR